MEIGGQVFGFFQLGTMTALVWAMRGGNTSPTAC
jgi:hypothetical protein